MNALLLALLAITAAELSGPADILRDYCKARIDATGEAVLPPGPIVVQGTADLRSHSGSIKGAGPAYHPHGARNGYNTSPTVAQGVTRLIAAYPGEPVLRLDRCEGLRIADLSIETDGVGIHLVARRGWGNFHNRLERVAFHGCSVGFEAGQKAGDFNGADVVFTGCYWRDCKTGVRVNHNQGVNWTFDGQCSWDHCGDAVVMRGGGIVTMSHPRGFGLSRLLVLAAGGANLMHSRIESAYLDRHPSQPPTVIVDASEATGTVRPVVDGFQVSVKPSDYTTCSEGKRHYKWADHALFRLPRIEWVRDASRITVRDAELQGAAGADVTPRVVPEDAGVSE